MSEIQFIGDYLSIRLVRSLNSLQQTVKQTEELSKQDALINIRRNMDQVRKNLTEDMLLLMPLEGSIAWNEPAQLLRIVTKLQKNLTKEANESELILGSVENEMDSVKSSQIQSTSQMANHKLQSNVKCPEDKLTETQSHKYGEIQNILVAQTQIASQHQQTKRNFYENWPLIFDDNTESKSDRSGERKSETTTENEFESKLSSKLSSKLDKQTDISFKKKSGFFYKHIRLFTTKPKVIPTFYVDLNEY